MTLDYTCGLGIETGDRVSTSYGTGPYQVVHVSAPTYLAHYVGALVILPWPTVSLSLLPADPKDARSSYCYLGEIRQTVTEQGVRYFSNKDEIFVTKGAGNHAQLSLFAQQPAPPQPYAFQPGVNYACLDGELWHCPRCSADFNALRVPTIPTMVPGDPRGHNPPCPHCGSWPEPRYVIQPGEVISSFWVQNHGRMVTQYRAHHPERIAYLDTHPTKRKST